MPPPVAGAEAWEEPDWVLAEPVGVAWLDALAEEHRDAVIEWRRSVAYVVDLQAQVDGERRAWRRAVRDAIASGEEAPQPPPDADDAVSRARLEVGMEDGVAARDAVFVALGYTLRTQTPEGKVVESTQFVRFGDIVEGLSIREQARLDCLGTLSEPGLSRQQVQEQQHQREEAYRLTTGEPCKLRLATRPTTSASGSAPSTVA
jgi:hypothetical protein